MNKVMLIGRLVKDPMTKYLSDGMAVSRYSLAVNRKTKENTADFISCVAFGKNAEFVEKYLRKGMKMAIIGHIQTGSYTDPSGNKHYTTDVIVDEHEFAESKSAAGGNTDQEQTQRDDTGFMNIPDGVEEEVGLPWE